MIRSKISIHSDDIDSWKKQWENLLNTFAGHRAFLSPTWLLQTCKHLGKKPFVISVWDQDNLKALLPLVYTEENGKRIFEFPNAVLGEWLDILAIEDSAALAALRALMDELHPQDAIYFMNLSKKSRLISAFGTLVEDRADLNYDLKVRLPAPYIDISNGWIPYLENKTHHFRYGLTTLYKEIEELNLMMVPFHQSGLAAEAVVEFFLENTVQRFREKSVYFPPTVQAFVRETYPAFISKNYLSTHVMIDSQKKLRAFTWEVYSGDKSSVLGFQLAYDEKLKKTGIARYLILSAIERACREEIKTYDLGRTTNDLKERLKTDESKSFGLTISRKATS